MYSFTYVDATRAVRNLVVAAAVRRVRACKTVVMLGEEYNVFLRI